MPSMSREFAAWVAGLTYDDLPPEVIDRAKGLTLQGLSSALLGYGQPQTDMALAVMQEEEAGGAGVATVLVHGAKLTKGGACYVNSDLMFLGGKWDTFRMLTHPGCAILPVALMASEVEGVSGKDYITGIVAAYEVMERMAADFIPTVMSRGFHAGPVFGIFGAAVAAAKIGGLNAEQIHGAIAQCVNLASGNLEGIRSGGNSIREGGAVRNALLAVALGRHGMPGGETVLEGDAGFYHAYTGNNQGELRYSFTADNRTTLDKITKDLGKEWMILETLYRIYSTAGYNIAHVDVTAALCEEHDIQPDDVERVEAVVNWLETEYPSPAFPARSTEPKVGSTQYYSAYGVVERSFPMTKFVEHGIGPDDPPAVLEMMKRVTVVPSHRHTLFGPRVTIHLKDGRSVTRAGTGREFIWDFEEEVRRISPIIPGIPIPEGQYQDLIAACRDLDTLERADKLVGLTVVPD